MIKSITNGQIMRSTNPYCSTYEELYKYLDNKMDIGYPLISIVLPVYNEEKTIGNILKRLPNHPSIEILVVDDHSIDKSIKEIEKFNSGRKITIIKHSQNKGYGGALLSGIKNGKGKVIVTLDSDGQHCPEDIFNLVKPILDDEVDYMIGSRYLGSYHYNLPITTRLGEAIIEKCIQVLFRLKVMNNQNGYRAFHRKLIHIFNDIKYTGYAFATELILKASIYNYRIRECPITLHDREHGTSKIKLRILTLDLFACLARYYVYKLRRYVLRKGFMEKLSIL